MEREQHKPDAVVRVNDFDITIYRRGQGLHIDVAKEGQEVGFFGIAGTPLVNQQETSALPVAPPAPSPEPTQSARSETPAPVAAPSPATSETKKELSTPVKIEGTVEEIEGLGQTPTTGDAIFRLRVKRMNPLTREEEIVQIAAFRHIAQRLDELTRSSDPNTRLLPGRPISMMAFDHREKTGSYYPSSVNYLNLPAITNPKRR